MSCEPILNALKQCLLASDCVTKEGRLPSDCMKNHALELPEECQLLRLSMFECKRSMVSDIGHLENALTVEGTS